MANIKTERRHPRFPGMHIFHDIRNEKFLLRDTARVRSAGPTSATAEEPFKPVKASLRAYWNVSQDGSTCTAAGSTTGLCAAPIGYTKPPLSYLERYALIQAEDRRNGRVYDEGGTSVAAAMVMLQRGEISEFRWGSDFDTLLRILAHPDKTKRIGAFCGTVWYESMFSGDAEGIIRVRPESGNVGGHFYFCGAYDPRRDLVDIYQSWGVDPANGMWKQRIGGNELYRILKDDGEFFAITEVPRAKKKAA